jgi:DNA-binding transcriptional MerR regulator
MQNQKSLKLEIPDKLYFKIGEVGTISGLPTYVLRFWETEFPKINPKRTSSGQRLYRRNDVELILDIKHLLYDKKFTIPGAKKHLGAKTRGKTKKPFTEVINEIRQELEEIRNLLA